MMRQYRAFLCCTALLLFAGSFSISRAAYLYYNADIGVAQFDSTISAPKVLGNTAAGTAGGYSFSSDGGYDTGMFSPSDGVIDFYNNAVQRMRIDASGNVGIGTTAPGARLEINTGGGSVGQNGLYVYHSADVNYNVARFLSNWGDGSGGNLLRVGNATGDALVVDKNRNVGIAMTVPSAKLEILSDAPATTANLKLTSGQDRTPRIRFNGPWSISNATESYAQILAQNDNGGPGAGAAASLRFYTSSGDPAVLSEKMAIMGSGNVGIGTTAPGAKLDVQGGDIKTSGVGYFGANAIIGTNIAGGYYQDAVNGAYRAIPTTGDVGYYFQNNAGAATTMYVGLRGTYAGRVGVNTLGPGYALDVGGQINASGGLCIAGDCKTAWSQVGSGNYVAKTGDTMSGSLNFTNYGIGPVGTYSDVRYQQVFSMGTSWVLPADGTTPGNLYGLAWTHSNMGGQARPGLTHQLLVMENGITKVALGSGIWSNYNIAVSGANSFYFQDYGGGWYMSDTSWMRSTNSKSTWLGSGWYGTDGGLTIGYGGATGTAGNALIAGNVGIGTTGPANKLHVGASNGNGINIGVPSDGMNYTSGAMGAEVGRYNINFYGWRDSTPNQIGAKISALRINAYQVNNALMQGTALTFSTAVNGAGDATSNYQDTSVERMRIDNNGNVGIGTTAPGYKLDVAGDINLTGTLRVNGTPFSSGYWGINGGNLYNTSGNYVGIGTNSPQYGLDVVGQVRAQYGLYVPSPYVVVAEGQSNKFGASVWNSGNYLMCLYTFGLCQVTQSGSSIRFKDKVSDFPITMDDAKKALEINPRQFHYKANPNKNSMDFGYIAEEVDALGFKKLVVYEDDGVTPRNIRYERLSMFLVPWIKLHNEQLAAINQAISFNGTNVGIGTNTPGAKLDVVGDARFSGSVTIGGGTGKITVGTIDPPYTINGKKYATYLPGMVGQKEETTGVARLTRRAKVMKYEIDFSAQTEGSDAWLFAHTTDLKNNMSKMSVLLTPAFDGQAWYSVDAAAMRLTIYGRLSQGVKSNGPMDVSYRLSAPRFDAKEWGNTGASDAPAGFVINDK